jgi:glycosyltransferase involved in cell wall biosynthesis
MGEKVIIINCRFLTQKITGVQRFAIEICLELKKINKNLRFVAPYNIIQNDTAEKLGVEIIGKKSGYYWEQIELPNFLRKNGNPLLLNLCNTAPISYKNNALVIHDICCLKHPEWFSKKFYLFYKLLIPNLVKSVRCLFTVSDFSKREISYRFNYPLERITVINNAVNVRATRINQNGNSKFLNSEKYILAVSSISPRKNFSGIIASYIKLNDPSIDLVLVGEGYKSFPQIYLEIPDHLKDRIHFLGYVNDDELERLYSKALMFVYPSLYEGFGIPPIEAMSYGCPVIVSNTTSLPEVCKQGAIYVNPKDISEIEVAIRKLLESMEYRKEMIERGYEVVSSYSWQGSAFKLFQSIKAAV